MSNIDLEMAELAEILEKSVKKEDENSSDYELLVDTIMTLGPDELKKAIPSLNENQKALLQTTLNNMQKAKSMDSKMPKGGPKIRQAQSEEVTSKPHDEDDEELMEEASAKQSHQGGSEDKPEGWEGQVVKAEAQENDLEKARSKSAKFESCVKQVKEKQGGAEGPVNPWAVCHASVDKAKDKGPDMKYDEKTLKDMMKRMHDRGMRCENCKEPLMKKGHSSEEIQQLWSAVEAEGLEKAKKEKESKKEEKKEEAAEKIMAMVEKEHDTKDPKKLVEEEKKEHKKMKESIVWNSKTDELLKATIRRGQNCHYTVEDYLLKSEAENAETIKKGGYLNEKANEEALKESRSTSLNDIIENKLDRSNEQVESIVSLKKSAPKGAATVQSYNLSELAASLNIPAEEAAKVLGVEVSELDKK